MIVFIRPAAADVSRLLHRGGHLLSASTPQVRAVAEATERSDAYSVVLLEFDSQDAYGRWAPLNKEGIRGIRTQLQSMLEPRESVLFYGERDLLIIMPGVSPEILQARIRKLRESFNAWQTERLDPHRDVRMNLGFSVCEGEEDFSRTLEVASLVMHPENDEEPEPAEES